jgi:hypothetical protein
VHKTKFKKFMKKLFSVLSLFMIAGATVFAGRIDNPSKATNMAIIRNGTVVKVIYKPEISGVAKVSITNSKGVEIFKEHIRSKNGFSRPYNIGRLPVGTYTVKVSDADGDYTEEIVIAPGKEFTYKVDKLAGDENKYALFIPETEAVEVDVRIYTTNGGLLYKATEAIQNSFARVYNLRNVEGEVSFVVTPK